MMEQEEVLDFKALRAKFQQEDPLKLMSKPAIPQKPKVIPPPPSGNRMSLISTINAAVENKMVIAPRVVFKDDKRQPLKPAPAKSKDKEANVKLELTDKKQKKEGDIVKQAMKDKKLPLVLPVPVTASAPEPAPPPQPEPPAKTSTLKKKGISIFKKPAKPPKVKAEAVENTSPVAPSSPPSNGTGPVVNTPVTQKPLLPPIPVTAPALDGSGSDPPAPAAPTPVAQKPLLPPIPATAMPPSIPEPITPEAAVSAPDVPALDVMVPEISSPSIPEPEVPAPEEAAILIPDPEVPAPEISALPIPDLEVPTPEITSPAIPDLDVPTPEVAVEPILEPDVPSPDITDEIIPEVAEVPEPEISVSDITSPEISVPDEPVSEIYDLDIPAPIIPPPEIPDLDIPDPEISDPIIPDPIIQDVDITDPSIPDETSLDPPVPIVPAPSISADDCLAISQSPTSEQVAPPEPTLSPLPPELPPAPEEFAEVEDATSETKQHSTSASIEETIEAPQCTTPLSALERAEEASPGKRTPTSDQRILTLLEKAKRKYATHQANKAPSPSASPVPPVTESPTQAEPDSAGSPPPSLPELPPVDYEEPVGVAGAEPVEEQGQHMNSFDHRQVSPILEEPLMEEAQAELPPVTPARKPLPVAPEKPPQLPVEDLSPYQLITHIPEPQEENEVAISAPQDLSPEEPVLDPQNPSPVVPEFEDVPDIGTPEVEIPECGISESSTLEEPVASAEVPEEGSGILEEDYVAELPGAEAAALPDSTQSPVSQDVQTPAGPQESLPEISDSIYEDLVTNKKKSKKRKSPPKNPYAETQPAPEETQKSGWFKAKKSSAEIAEEKELKKKEKQQEKEREKEREREKKEQKEREKKENEMKKKFKITGQEEPMYEAKVTVASKGKNNDLPCKSGDIVSIIRTTNCPKGKWLARDSNNKYGYIPVKSVELDIKEMLEMGKKVSKSASLPNSQIDGDIQNLDSGMSNHYELTTESFSDDDEWNDDEEHEPLSPTEHTHATDNGVYGMLSIPETVSPEPESPVHTLSDANTDDQHMQARHEALQKLATFFKQPPTPDAPTPEDDPSPQEEETSTAANFTNCSAEEADPEAPDMQILPPPDLYADVITEEDLYAYSN